MWTFWRWLVFLFSQTFYLRSGVKYNSYLLNYNMNDVFYSKYFSKKYILISIMLPDFQFLVKGHL